jgi:3-dehydroquinate dehydratase/shikimate dehydrogenase
VKVAAPISGTADALAFVRAAEELAGIEEKILLGEGEAGLFTRILYRRFGSLWTYAVAGGTTADAEDRAAPETPALRELAEVYRASEIDRETKLLGIIGNPVAHSRSPLIHNGWLRDAGLNAVYLPFLVDDPGAFFRLAEALPVDGFSVTVPHKQAVISELDELDPAVRKIGACNTVYRGPMGWHGTNTDYEGFLSPLRDLLERGAIRRCLVVGAGGAARTAAHALNDRGVEVSVCNRTVEKAVRLAAETGGTGMSPEEAPEAGPYDLIVQTTSVGMEPHPEEDPLPSYRFSGAETVYDVIYTPEVTRIMQRARRMGCTTIGGAEMLRTQAEAQFRIFTGGLSPRAR